MFEEAAAYATHFDVEINVTDQVDDVEDAGEPQGVAEEDAESRLEDALDSMGTPDDLSITDLSEPMQEAFMTEWIANTDVADQHAALSDLQESDADHLPLMRALRDHYDMGTEGINTTTVLSRLDDHIGQDDATATTQQDTETTEDPFEVDDVPDDLDLGTDPADNQSLSVRNPETQRKTTGVTSVSLGETTIGESHYETIGQSLAQQEDVEIVCSRS